VRLLTLSFILCSTYEGKAKFPLYLISHRDTQISLTANSFPTCDRTRALFDSVTVLTHLVMININATLFHSAYILNERNWYQIMTDYDYTNIQYCNISIVRIISWNYWNELKSTFERSEKNQDKNLPGALSKDRSSILWMNACCLNLARTEAHEFIARITSCLSLLN